MKDEINFTPFYSAFLQLCELKDKSPSAVAKETGISSGAPTAWKNGAVPKPAQREKLCAYFSVSDEMLLGYEPIKKPSTPEGEGLSEPWITEAISLLRQLRPENQKQVFDFAQALLKIQESAGGQLRKDS